MTVCWGYGGAHAGCRGAATARRAQLASLRVRGCSGLGVRRFFREEFFFGTGGPAVCLAAADGARRAQVLLSLLLAGAGGGRATDATGERLAALLGALAAAPADQAPVLLAGAAGAEHSGPHSLDGIIVGTVYAQRYSAYANVLRVWAAMCCWAGTGSSAGVLWAPRGAWPAGAAARGARAGALRLRCQRPCNECQVNERGSSQVPRSFTWLLGLIEGVGCAAGAKREADRTEATPPPLAAGPEPVPLRPAGAAVQAKDGSGARAAAAAAAEPGAGAGWRAQDAREAPVCKGLLALRKLAAIAARARPT